MLKMSDGIQVQPSCRNITSSCPSKERLNEIFMKQNIYGERLDLVYDVCLNNINEILYQHKLLDIYRLSPAKWHIEFRVYSQDEFYAHAAKTSEEQNNYEISYSLGIPATLLSIAIELDSDSKIIDYENSNRNAINDWFPHVQDKKSVKESTINLVLDACLLLYFHEVGHVLFGHCALPKSNHLETRALELDADFNAGAMFGLCLDGFTSDSRKPKSSEDILTRAIRAGYLVGIALKALSKKTSEYHYPTNRIITIYGGCMAALISTNRLTDVNYNQTKYEKFILDTTDNLSNLLRNSSLSYYVGTEEDINHDYHELMSITAPLRDQLKDGSLKKLSIPYQT